VFYHFSFPDTIIIGEHILWLCQIPLIVPLMVIMGQFVGDTESCNEFLTVVLNELLYVSPQLPFSRAGVTDTTPNCSSSRPVRVQDNRSRPFSRIDPVSKKSVRFRLKRRKRIWKGNMVGEQIMNKHENGWIRLNQKPQNGYTQTRFSNYIINFPQTAKS